MTGTTDIPGVGIAGGALGLYGGIKQGGVVGDTNAALSAAQIASQAGAYAGSTSLAAIGAYAGPIGLALAPALYGMSQQPYTLSSKYYSNMNNTIAAGPGNGSDPNQIGRYWGAVLEAQTSGDPAEQAILLAHGLSPTTSPVNYGNSQQTYTGSTGGGKLLGKL
jgi:hypothetical protein